MKAFIAAIALLLSLTASAQTTLRDEILAADKKLFDGFNARDIKVVATMFDESLEFYHDRGGLSGYAETIKGLGENFKNPGWPTRELIADSVEVHPIPNYGAVEAGAHRFCHEEEGKQICGTFKFLHVWQKKDGAWKITRVISYDH